MKKLVILLMLLMVAALANNAPAADTQWDAGASDSNDWVSAENWQFDAVPAAGEQAYVSTNATPPGNPSINPGDTVPAADALSHIVVGGGGIVS